jgi:hypothetical protein
MPTLQTADFLKYSQLQMAAEAFLNDKGETSYIGKSLSDALERGNKHASLFSAPQAADRRASR